MIARDVSRHVRTVDASISSVDVFTAFVAGPPASGEQQNGLYPWIKVRVVVFENADTAIYGVICPFSQLLRERVRT